MARLHKCKECGKDFWRQTSQATCSITCRETRQKKIEQDYLTANRSRARARGKEHYNNNKDRVLEMARVKYAQDEEFKSKSRARSNKSRARFKATDPMGYRLAWRNKYLVRSYGLTVEEYDKLMLSQDSKCAICGLTEGVEGKISSLYVDHDHETGEVRGLLCMLCNTAIGAFRENLSVIEKAAKYLAKTYSQRRKSNAAR